MYMWGKYYHCQAKIKVSTATKSWQSLINNNNNNNSVYFQ